MTGHTALVLGDQLSHDNPALRGARRVLLVESRASLERLPHHRQRRHLVLSAMRHFAAELRERGDVEVDERRGVDRFADVLRGERDVLCAGPNSAPTRRWLERRGVRFVPSTQFLTPPAEFAEWARGRKRLVMEDFYRGQRRRHGLLLEPGGKPTGGRWNFDKANRRPPRDGLHAPAPWLPQEDDIDAEVRRDLDAMGLRGWGEDAPRAWPATAAEARTALDAAEVRARDYGDGSDKAMVATHRALLDVALAREAAAAGDAERAASLRRAAGARTASTRHASEHLRAARRLLGRALAEGAYVVADDGSWFRTPDGKEVSLARRQVLRRLLSALLAERAAGAGNAVSSDRLMEAGWPGEHIDPLAAANRLHVGLTTLRNLGLREVLVRDESGYRIAAEAAVIVRRGRE
jgi:hypothetical protein